MRRLLLPLLLLCALAFALPFAATTSRVWGVVRPPGGDGFADGGRPGSSHRVAIEARTSSGAYREVRALQTDARGGFSASVRAPVWARYVRARVLDNTAGASLASLGVRVR